MIEYNNLALAFDPFQDYYKVDYYWKKAIDSCEKKSRLTRGSWYARLFKRHKSDYTQWSPRILKGTLTLRYADFLFNNQEHDACRQQFRTAIELFDFDRDQAHWQAGWAFIIWSRIERMSEQIELSKECLKNAKLTYSKLKNERMRLSGMQLVEQEISRAPTQ